MIKLILIFLACKYTFPEAYIDYLNSRYQKMILEATAYCSCTKCCLWDKGITASGKRVSIGMVAMDKTIPFGTKILIPSMKQWQNRVEYTVEDRGGDIGKGRIDIYFSTHKQALRFGRRKILVYLERRGNRMNRISKESTEKDAFQKTQKKEDALEEKEEQKKLWYLYLLEKIRGFKFL